MLFFTAKLLLKWFLCNLRKNEMGFSQITQESFKLEGVLWYLFIKGEEEKEKYFSKGGLL